MYRLFLSFRMLFSSFGFARQIRSFHRSAFLFARGIRRSNESPPSTSSPTVDTNLSIDKGENNPMLVQEQFARLELQRLEQESNPVTHEPNSFVDEDHPDLDNDSEKVFIDPSTTSVILFPGQGTQFVGMG